MTSVQQQEQQQQQQHDTFVPSKTFSGARAGYAFKAGKLGLGYYKDALSSTSEAKVSSNELKRGSATAAASMIEGKKEEKEQEGVLVQTRYPGQYVRVISKSLIEACKINDVKAVSKFLAEDSGKPENEPGAADAEGHTCLHWAALKNHEKVAALLLQADKSIVNVSNSRGETPIHWAVIKGNLRMVSLLLRNGADASACDRNGYNVLHKAAQYKLTLVIDYFYRLGEDLKEREDGEEVVERWVLKSGGSEDTKAVERMRASTGAGCILSSSLLLSPLFTSSLLSPQLSSPHVSSPLLTSAHLSSPLLSSPLFSSPLPTPTVPPYPNSSRVPKLTGKIPAIDSLDAHGRTPLHWACYKGDSFTAQYLIRKGTDITVRDDELCTPLHWAAIKGQKKIVVILLRLGAEEHLLMKDKFGLTPLEVCCSHQSVSSDSFPPMPLSDSPPRSPPPPPPPLPHPSLLWIRSKRSRQSKKHSRDRCESCKKPSQPKKVSTTPSRTS